MVDHKELEKVCKRTTTEFHVTKGEQNKAEQTKPLMKGSRPVWETPGGVGKRKMQKAVIQKT